MSLPDNYIYATNWYAIIPNPEKAGYIIWNRVTGVIEDDDAMVLPSAISKIRVLSDLMDEAVNNESSNRQ